MYIALAFQFRYADDHNQRVKENIMADLKAKHVSIPDAILKWKWKYNICALYQMKDGSQYHALIHNMLSIICLLQELFIVIMNQEGGFSMMPRLLERNKYCRTIEQGETDRHKRMQVQG